MRKNKLDKESSIDFFLGKGMNGLEPPEVIRKDENPSLCSMPVILQSYEGKIAFEGARLGARGFAYKPLEKSSLTSLISKVLDVYIPS